MKNRIKILLNDISKIRKFNKIVTSYSCDIDLVKGRYIIDAKSTIGIFTLDLLQPVEVVIHSINDDEINKFNEEMEEFK